MRRHLKPIHILRDIPSIGATAAFFLCLLLLPTRLQAGQNGDFTYDTDGPVTDPASITITGYTGSGTDVVIPSTIEGLPVAAVGAEAFFLNTNVKTVSIPAGVTSIGKSAFGACSGLTSISLPDSVTFIGESAFQGCTALTSFDFPPGITSVSNYIFLGCYQLDKITLPDGLATIGVGAFSGCGIPTVSIPTGVSAIGEVAFSSTRLKSILFKGNAPTLGLNALPESKLLILVYPAAAGFTVPSWNGFTCISLEDFNVPFVLLERNTAVLWDTVYNMVGEAGSSVSKEFSILNIRDTPQTFAAFLSNYNTSYFSLKGQPSPATVAPGATASFTVDYMPREVGTKTAMLDILSSESGDSARHLSLLGAGTTPLEAAQSTYLKTSGNKTGNSFGTAIAASGDTVIVGATGGFNESGAVNVFVKSATGWTQQATLKAANGKARDRFGSSVAFEGDTVVVGAPWQSTAGAGVNPAPSAVNAESSGAVYVFTREGSVWTQQAWFKASNADIYDGFGNAVSISGDTIAVGASSEDSAATGVNGDQTSNAMLNSGAVYLFTRTDGVWSQSAWLKASNTGIFDSFGTSVAVSGGTVVVGATDESSHAIGINGDQTSDSASKSGAAYVFAKTGPASWEQQAYLKASNTHIGDEFGQSVAISGDTIVVGAPFERGNAQGVNATPKSGMPCGAAYIFSRTGSVWRQEAYLKSFNYSTNHSSHALSARMGWSVAISGDTVIAGADKHGTVLPGKMPGWSYPTAGAAFVFQRISTQWLPRLQLMPYNASTDDAFGASVAISGNIIAAGAPGEDSAATTLDGNQADGTAPNAGAAYLFEIGLKESAPAFTAMPPESQTAVYRTPTTLTVGISGNPAPRLQWYRGISGDTSDPVPEARWKSLRVSPSAVPGTYWVQAFNPKGSIDSPSLTIIPAYAPLEEWRITHFGSPYNYGPAADTSDPDGDGVPNLDEFTAGTVPTDRADVFRITSWSPERDGAFVLTVPGRKDRTYQLMRSSDPAKDAWQPIAAQGPVAADGPVLVTDPAAPAGKAFYRVTVSMP